MRKHRKLLIALACVALAAGAIFFLNRDNQPHYRGRSLSQWLALIASAPTNMPDPLIAIDHIGTNSLPCLLKWLQYERPKWRDTLSERAPESMGDIITASAELQADASRYALVRLGTNAAGAIPQLTAMACNTNAPDTAWRAMQALAATGTAGLQALLAIALDTNNPSCHAAIGNIGGAPSDGPYGTMKVAALRHLLVQTKSPTVKGPALYHLGSELTIPNLAVPVIVECITNDTTDNQLRWAAILALRRFGSKATGALSLLTNTLTDPSPTVRQAAALSIEAIVHPSE